MRRPRHSRRPGARSSFDTRSRRPGAASPLRSHRHRPTAWWRSCSFRWRSFNSASRGDASSTHLACGARVRPVGRFECGSRPRGVDGNPVVDERGGALSARASADRDSPASRPAPSDVHGAQRQFPDSLSLAGSPAAAPLTLIDCDVPVSRSFTVYVGVGHRGPSRQDRRPDLGLRPRRGSQRRPAGPCRVRDTDHDRSRGCGGRDHD